MTLLGALCLAPAAFAQDSGNSQPARFEILRAQAEQALNVGATDQALLIWQHALAQAQGRENPAHVFTATIQLASIHQKLGQHETALTLLLDAQSVFPEIRPRDETALRVAIARSLIQVGDFENANIHLERAIHLSQSGNDTALRVAVLNALGNLLIKTGQSSQAIERYTAALELIDASDHRLLHLQIQANLARAYLDTQQYEQASTTLKAAVAAVPALLSSHDKTLATLGIGRLLLRLPNNDDQAVADLFEQATNAASSSGDLRLLSLALGYQGEWLEARRQLEQALHVTGRALFKAQEANANDLLYRWHWQAGRILAADGQLDAAILAYRDALTTLEPVRDLISRKHSGESSSFRKVIGPLFFQYADLLLQRADQPRDAESAQHDLEAARQAIERFKTAELEDHFEDNCVADLLAKSTGLDQIEKNTAILYPILLDDRIELLISFPDGIQRFTVAVSKHDLESEVHRFRTLLEKRTTRQYLRPARKLYEWLIEPAREALTARDIQTLVLVPDGVLRTVPLSALNDGKHYLVEQYALAYTPGLLLTDPQPLAQRKLSILLSGLTESVQGFPALPYVREELESIRSRHKSTVLLNQDYLVSAVENSLMEQPWSVVHIASHAIFSGNTDDTFILAWDDKISLDRLEGLIGIARFRDQPIELLTLSACQTATGDDRAALGLAGIAVKAGARSAVASLWSVSDPATTVLMAALYDGLDDPAMNKAQALRAAQLKLLRESRYRHPAYWSPFLLIGNWL